MPSNTTKSVEPVEDSEPDVTVMPETLTQTVTVSLKATDDYQAISMDVEILSGVFDDFEMLDDIAEAMAGDGTRYPRILRRLVTGEERRRIFGRLREASNGRIVTALGIDFVANLLNEANPNS